MRSYTLLVSLIAHAVLLLAAFVAQATTLDAPPVPSTPTTWIPAQIAPQPVVPVRPRASTDHDTTPVTTAAPVQARTGLAPEPAALMVEPDAPDGVIVGAGVPAGIVLEPTPPPPQRGPTPPVRPGGVIRTPQKVLHVAPVYPPLARAASVSGVVILEALIDQEGAVRDVKVLRSIPLLDQAAIDAVRRWRFTPTLLNGNPVPVLMTVTVNFALN